MARFRRIGRAALVIAVTLAAPAATAQDKAGDSPPPAQISGLLNCRGVASDAERLACYDQAASVISEAIARKDLVAFDRESVRKTKRGLFGLSIPDLGIFGDDDDAVEISQIESEIVSSAFNGDGGYIFRLADGSRWTQTDGKPIAIPPEAGDKVVVKKGALGSYILSVARQPGVKVRRTN